jgi:hypothetical protein
MAQRRLGCADRGVSRPLGDLPTTNLDTNTIASMTTARVATYYLQAREIHRPN